MAFKKALCTSSPIRLRVKAAAARLPDWRKFAVQSMSKVELLDEHFPGSRAVPSQKHQEWDVLFARVD